MKTKKMLRLSEVRRLYGVPRDRLYAAVRSGELPAINVGSSKKASFLVRLEDVERWLASLTVKGTE